MPGALVHQGTKILHALQPKKWSCPCSLKKKSRSFWEYFFCQQIGYHPFLPAFGKCHLELQLPSFSSVKIYMRALDSGSTRWPVWGTDLASQLPPCRLLLCETISKPFALYYWSSPLLLWGEGVLIVTETRLLLSLAPCHRLYQMGSQGARENQHLLCWVLQECALGTPKGGTVHM